MPHNLFKEPIKLRLGVIFDLDAAALVAQFHDAYACSEDPLELIDRRFDVRVDQVSRRFPDLPSGPVGGSLLNQRLHLTHG